MRKRPIALLPMRKPGECAAFFDPMRRSRFYVFNKIRKADGGMETCENVQMVPNATNPVRVAVVILNDPPDVSGKIIAAGMIQNGFAVPGRKDDVVENLRVG